MSVLSHVVLRGPQPAEPAATQAMEYILRNPKALSGFVDSLSLKNVTFEPQRVESEVKIGEGQPDLVIYDTNGEMRLMVENKFWAGLTEAQPNAYLKQLPKHNNGTALVFVVPDARKRSMWAELQHRCDQEFESNLTKETGPVVSAELSENRLIAVTSWQSVLEELAKVPEIRSDVAQLRALVDKVDDLEAFLPLRQYELNDVEIARRMINYIDLVDAIVDTLKERCPTRVEKLRVGNTQYASFRYLTMKSQSHSDQYIGFGLGVDFKLWKGVYDEHWKMPGITPLWFVMHNNPENKLTNVWSKLEKIFDDMVVDENGPFGIRKCLPIRLLTGVERDTVIEQAADRTTEIADRILVQVSE